MNYPKKFSAGLMKKKYAEGGEVEDTKTDWDLAREEEAKDDPPDKYDPLKAKAGTIPPLTGAMYPQDNDAEGRYLRRQVGRYAKGGVVKKRK